jgi:nucleotide-binding universal stress UspA family protein
MPSPPTLIFGDDGSANADRAWLWINSHAWPGWRIEVVSAETPQIAPLPTPEAAQLHEWEPPARRPVGGATQFGELVHLTAVIDPRLALGRAAELLVIGPSGHGLLKALHLGSTAEWLLRRPAAPTVVVRAPTPVATVLACHDGSAHATHMVQQLVALPWVAGTGICVLVVDDGRTDPEATAAMARRDFAAGEIDPEVVTAAGAPTPVISEMIGQRRPDLVALGTRGLSGIQRIRRGSTAGTIARTAPCSVFVGADVE